jgi:hypothetical protein
MPRARWAVLIAAQALLGVWAGKLATRNPNHGERQRARTAAAAAAPSAIPMENPSWGAASRRATSDASAAPPLGKARPPASAPSLVGASVDGAFEVDASGRFVATASAVRLFDFFLSAEGEIPDGDLRENVKRQAERSLPPAEAGRALALFDRYVDYRLRAATRLAEAAAAGRGDALAAIHRERQEAFGEADAQRMFGEAETITAVTMNEADIEASDLPAGERARRIAEQEESLPPWLRAVHARRALDSEELAAMRNRSPSPNAANTASFIVTR